MKDYLGRVVVLKKKWKKSKSKEIEIEISLSSLKKVGRKKEVSRVTGFACHTKVTEGKDTRQGERQREEQNDVIEGSLRGGGGEYNLYLKF